MRKDTSITAASSFMKLPNIESSPDYKTMKQVDKKIWNIQTTLPTLCLNRGWMNPLKTSTSDNSQNITKFGVDNQNSTTITQSRKLNGTSLISLPQSMMSNGSKIQENNPFRIFRETEKLLYNYENRKKVLEETYISPLTIPLQNKNQKPREGIVREFNDIEPLELPVRLQKKRMLKSQSAATLHQNNNYNSNSTITQDQSNQNLQISTIDNTLNNTSTNQLSLQALIEKYDQSTLFSKRTKMSSKIAALDVLRRCNQFKETPKEFVTLTRDILRSNMSISNINEESERLRDYIIMEQEKIREAKHQFDEDCQRFHDYLEQINFKNSELNTEQEKLKKEKNLLNKQIDEVTSQIKDVKNDLKKVDGSLTDYKELKTFIHQVLIQTKTEEEEQNCIANQKSQEIGDQIEGQEDPSNIFITNQKKNSINKKAKTDDDLPVNTKQFKKLIMNLKKENLFVIGLINEEEKLYEYQVKNSDVLIKQKEKDLELYEENLQRLENQLKEKRERHKYFQNQSAQNNKSQNMSKQQRAQQTNDMSRLQEAITKICQQMDPGKDNHREPVKQLELIENRLQYLLEAREYIINSDAVKASEVQQCERKLDIQRRNEKVEKLKKAEKDAIIYQQIKNDERARKNMEKVVQVGQRKDMTRSIKPEPQRKVKEEVQLTEEQLDYMKYVLKD
eukprot:403361685